MGPSQSSLQITKYDQKQWQFVQNNHQYDVFRNKQTKILAQMTHIILNPKNQVTNQIKIYQYRKNTDAPIVKAYSAKILKSKNIDFCGLQTRMKILTQRIIKRWSQFPQLTLSQSLYCLRQALEGYRLLFTKVGPFQINNKMLGINKNGQLKVWLNQNFAVNHPNYERKILQTSQDNRHIQNICQQNCIKNIINLIQDKNQEGIFPIKLRNKLIASSNCFKSCQNALNEYITENRVKIVKNIHPNLRYLINQISNKQIQPQSNKLRAINTHIINNKLVNSTNNQNQIQKLPFLQVQSQLLNSKPINQQIKPLKIKHNANQVKIANRISQENSLLYNQDISITTSKYILRDMPNQLQERIQTNSNNKNIHIAYKDDNSNNIYSHNKFKKYV